MKIINHKCRNHDLKTPVPETPEEWIAVGVENSPGLSEDDVVARLMAAAISNDLKRTWASKFAVAKAKAVCADLLLDYNEQIGNKEQPYATADEFNKVRGLDMTDDEAQEIADGIPFPAYSPKKTKKVKSVLEENEAALKGIVTMGVATGSQLLNMMTKKMGIEEDVAMNWLDEQGVE